MQGPPQAEPVAPLAAVEKTIRPARSVAWAATAEMAGMPPPLGRPLQPVALAALAVLAALGHQRVPLEEAERLGASTPLVLEPWSTVSLALAVLLEPAERQGLAVQVVTAELAAAPSAAHSIHLTPAPRERPVVPAVPAPAVALVVPAVMAALVAPSPPLAMEPW